MSQDREYMRKYMAERYERRMKEARARLGGRCVRCGSNDALEFDHIDPSTKLFTIGHAMAGVSQKRLDEELDKCQLLCQNCHKQKHEAEHGTISRYRYCRCDLCRNAKNKNVREYRQRKRNAVVA